HRNESPGLRRRFPGNRGVIASGILAVEEFDEVSPAYLKMDPGGTLRRLVFPVHAGVPVVESDPQPVGGVVVSRKPELADVVRRGPEDMVSGLGRDEVAGESLGVMVGWKGALKRPRVQNERRRTVHARKPIPGNVR